MCVDYYRYLDIYRNCVEGIGEKTTNLDINEKIINCDNLIDQQHKVCPDTNVKWYTNKESRIPTLEYLSF